MSLTALTDPLEIVKFHFGESIFGLTCGRISDGRLADVGSGGGFPGIPLYLACPSIRLTLIESNIKKCTFLREIARKLDIDKGVRIWNGRMEEFARDNPGYKADFVTARAVGQFENTIAFARDNLDSAGKIVFWIGEDDSEKIAAKHSRIWKWSAPVKIPNSEKRYVVSGEIL